MIDENTTHISTNTRTSNFFLEPRFSVLEVFLITQLVLEILGFLYRYFDRGNTSLWSVKKYEPSYEKIGQMTERERKACEDYSKAYQKIEQYKWEQKQKKANFRR